MLKIKSNIRIETCLCIHARAYFILCCVVLFKFRFEFNFLFGKALENKKKQENLPICVWTKAARPIDPGPASGLDAARALLSSLP
jgi:hypothetical protein